MADTRDLICKLRFEGRDPGEDRVFIVGDRPMTLGRASECDLVLNQESVSRAHARFSRSGDDWTVTDLDSKNGVKVNTFKIETQTLRDGDRIDLGTTRLYVSIGRRSAIAPQASVVFSERVDKPLHTEVLQMNGLSSFIVPGEGDHAGLGAPQAQSYGSQRFDPMGDARGFEDVATFLRLVTDATESLISCETLDETLDRILSLVFDNLPAERGLICLNDDETGRPEPKVTRTRDGVSDQPIHISSNIVQHVIEKKEALLVRDTQLDERFGSAESVIMMEIHSAMCAPLYRDDRVAGFIYIDRQSRDAPFATTHLHALSALAMLSAVAVETSLLRDGLRHEQELRARLARYSSPAVVDRILQAPGTTAPGMVTEEGDVTVLFADLKGFTGMAEQLPSAQVIGVLNQVFERLTEAVFQLDGTLDKFRGDGMMAFFGAPLPLKDHAERAVEAALRMQESLRDLNRQTNSLSDLRIRIGINSGQVVVGDIGTPQRKDYTVIGDAVNVASRLESDIAQPGQIVIGETTRAAIDGLFETEPLAPVQLKGKAQSVQPHLVRGRVRAAHATHGKPDASDL